MSEISVIVSVIPARVGMLPLSKVTGHFKIGLSMTLNPVKVIIPKLRDRSSFLLTT